MNDQALARCREMSFDELAGFIKDSLGRMHEPDPEQERPHDREEFLTAWRVLRQKSDSPKSYLPPPRNPLQKAYVKRLRLQNLLHEVAPGNPEFSKKDIDQMERTLDRLDRQIAELKQSGEHDPLPAPMSATHKQAAARTASEVFNEIDSVFKRKPTGRRIQWRLGRPGSLSVASIRSICEARRRRDSEFKYDIRRIENAYDLGPDGPPYVGPDGFDGYVIFTYRTKRALMECAEIGNAAYVIRKDWEEWSKMDKQELMAEEERGGEVTRIPHTTDDWPKKIRRALGLDRSA